MERDKDLLPIIFCGNLIGWGRFVEDGHARITIESIFSEYESKTSPADHRTFDIKVKHTYEKPNR